jgi:hypothetical protein
VSRTLPSAKRYAADPGPRLVREDPTPTKDAGGWRLRLCLFHLGVDGVDAVLGATEFDGVLQDTLDLLLRVAENSTELFRFLRQSARLLGIVTRHDIGAKPIEAR